MEITDIQLPAQTGCEHIHVIVLNDDNQEEKLVYHMKDFITKKITKDPIYNLIYDKIDKNEINTRSELIILKGEKINK